MSRRFVGRSMYSRFRSAKFIFFMSICNALVMLMNVMSVYNRGELAQTKQEIIREVIRTVPCEEDAEKEPKAKVHVKYFEDESQRHEEEDSDNELPLCSNVTEPGVECEIQFSDFQYPLEINMTKLVSDYKRQGHVDETVINKYTHTETLVPAKTCVQGEGKSSEKHVFMIYLIKSTPTNYARRNVIRKSWADEYKFPSIRLVFLMGFPVRSTLNEMIVAESKEFGDILQLDFIDTYYNLTLKAIGGIRWTAKNCPGAKFAIMGDDDYYVATDFMLSLLEHIHTFHPTSVYMGGLIHSAKPQRDRSAKWYISPADYPFNKYPPVIRGGTLVMSMDFVIDMNIVIPYTKSLPFDDVYFAIVAYKLGVKPMTEDRFAFRKVRYSDEEFRTVLSSHGYKRPFELKHAWRCHEIIQELARENSTKKTCW
ncbi:beta-1,3-galactosyltransferase brn-like [Mizuhopecten yessoensis]|uniref:Hexosyltransferase n=1 Tax=Mizuhopecten yessoensis TaxID=6573 RepID=A0A210R3S9_MIZYE|nr:beta-1,3-galactosyltransferase brn-like [Mizuhopecten yessoensis]OWF55648.1 Beta-1,3-galactosyltransferase brn [Mizuhopecten yessoensis]